MKGKYAAKAQRRQGLAEMEERATAAERERDKLASDLADMREGSERRIASLRAETRGMREQRDAVAAPRIAELEAANDRLRAQLRASELMVSERVRDKEGGFRVSGVLPGLDLTDEISSRVHSRRGGLNRAAAALEVVGTMKRLVTEERRSITDARAELQEFAEMLSIYAYDTADSSISIEWDLGPLGSGQAIDPAVRVRVESPAPGGQHGSLVAAVVLPCGELDRLAGALNESADDAAREGGDLLRDAGSLKLVGRDLADDPAD